jgi:hypothetical protein
MAASSRNTAACVGVGAGLLEAGEVGGEVADPVVLGGVPLDPDVEGVEFVEGVEEPEQAATRDIAASVTMARSTARTSTSLDDFRAAV